LRHLLFAACLADCRRSSADIFATRAQPPSLSCIRRPPPLPRLDPVRRCRRCRRLRARYGMQMDPSSIPQLVERSACGFRESRSGSLLLRIGDPANGAGGRSQSRVFTAFTHTKRRHREIDGNCKSSDRPSAASVCRERSGRAALSYLNENIIGMDHNGRYISSFDKNGKRIGP